MYFFFYISSGVSEFRGMRLLPVALIVATLDVVTAVDPLVDDGYTKYLGTELPNGISQWLGIRFAAAPVGDLRFRAPEDPPTNSSVQVADAVSTFLMNIIRSVW